MHAVPAATQTLLKDAEDEGSHTQPQVLEP